MWITWTYFIAYTKTNGLDISSNKLNILSMQNKVVFIHEHFFGFRDSSNISFPQSKQWLTIVLISFVYLQQLIK